MKQQGSICEGYIPKAKYPEPKAKAKGKRPGTEREKAEALR